jgi:acyl-coenzyme A thioesterase PaaI-like protein
MTFFDDGEGIVSNWGPKEGYQGYDKVLHGGIQATLIDEIASWVVYVRLGKHPLHGSHIHPLHVQHGKSP